MYVDGGSAREANNPPGVSTPRFRYHGQTSGDIRLLAVKCFDNAGAGYFLAAVGHEGNILVSDGSWKCSNTLEDDWYKLDFDDSAWTKAYDFDWKDRFPADFPDEAAFLWIDDDYNRKSGLSYWADRTIYCRSPIIGKLIHCSVCATF